MSLIIIGHTGLAAGERGKNILSAQTITKSGYVHYTFTVKCISFIFIFVVNRYSGVADEDEENDMEIVSLAQKMYGRLFAPDSILVRGDEDTFQTQEISFYLFIYLPYFMNIITFDNLVVIPIGLVK